jgi:hypothetical protein
LATDIAAFNGPRECVCQHHPQSARRAASNPSAAAASNSIQIMQRAFMTLSLSLQQQKHSMAAAQIVMRRLCKITLLFMGNLILLLFKLRLLDFGDVIGYGQDKRSKVCGIFITLTKRGSQKFLTD